MASKTRSLAVVLTGDDKDLKRALTGAGKASGDLEKNVKRHSLGISKAFIGAAAGAVSLGAGIREIKSSVATLETLAKGTAMVARSTGLDNKEASEWVTLAKVRGVEAKALNMGFVSLAKNIKAGADGTKASAAAFKELGISQAELKRGDTSEIIRDVSDAFAKMPDGANKAALAQKLFSRQAGTLLPLLNKGSAELNKQLGIVDKYGATLDKNGVKKANEAIQAQRELQIAWQGIQITLGQALIPLLTKGATKLGTFAKQFQAGTGAGGEFRDTVKDIGDKIASTAHWLKEHTGLVKAAALAWGAYKIAAVGAGAITKGRVLASAVGLGGRGAAAAGGGAILGGPAGVAAIAAAITLAIGQQNKSSRQRETDRRTNQFTIAFKDGDPAKVALLSKEMERLTGRTKMTAAEQAKWLKSHKELFAAAGLDANLTTKDIEGIDKAYRDLAKPTSRIKAAVQDAKDAFASFRKSGSNDMKGIRAVVATNAADIKRRLGSDTAEGKEALAKNFRAARTAIRQAMEDGKISVRDGLAYIKRLMRSELRSYGVTGGVASSIIKHGNINPNEGSSGDVAGGHIGAVTVAGSGYLGQIANGALDKVRGGANRALAALGASGASGGGSGSGSGLQGPASRGLSYIRSHFGAVNLSSGFRTAARNRAVGGAPNSDHLTGLAVDLTPAEGWTARGIAKLDRVAAWARTSPAIRWIGWRGVPGHGPGNHLHLSFAARMAAGQRGVGDVAAYGGGAAGDIVGYDGLKSLWTRAGGPPGQADTAAAVALAESGGDPRIVNSIGATGLWQIHPAEPGSKNPLTNAKQAVRKYRESGWQPWEAYTGPDGQGSDGPWRNFLHGGGGRSSGGSGGGAAGAFARHQAAGARGVRGAARAQHSLSGPGDMQGYEGTLATIGLEKADAQSHGSVNEMLTALYEEAFTKKKRLRKVRRALKRRLKPATRTRLTDEAAQLVADLKEIGALFTEYSANGMSADGSPGSPPEAADSGTGGGVDGAAAEGPTPVDFLDADATHAAMTADPQDDIKVAQRRVDYWQRKYNEALQTADPRDDVEFGNNLIAAKDALKGLTEALNSAAALQQQRDDTLKEFVENQKRILALVPQGPALMAAIVAAVNGGIGGQVGLGLQTPGYAGQTARY